MAIEVFTNQGSTTVSSGGTTAVSSGTVQTWTVSSSTGFPAASSTATPPTFFRVADPAAPFEKMLVTDVSGTTWTVTRGAESTTPTTHVSGFTVYNVVTAATLGGLAQSSQLSVGNSASAASLASAGTISTTATWSPVAPTAPVTGVILQAGAFDGQIAVVLNDSGFSVTFDAPGTSLVAGGTSETIPAASARVYAWSVLTSLWYPVSPAPGGANRVVMGTAFSSATGTLAQNVTGMAVTLAPGTYKVTAWAPMQPHGTTGSTQTLTWAFSGTASLVQARWAAYGSASVTVVTGNVFTTPIQTPTMTATGLVAEYAGHVTITVSGTLQLTVKSTVSGDEVTFPVGCYIDVAPLQ